MSFTRRQFGRVALAGAPAIGALLRGNLAAAAVGQAPPKLSQWAGVRVGLNVPYSLGTGNNIAAEDLLKRVVEVGVGSLELRAQPVEHFLGSPTVRAAAEAAKAREAAGRRRGRAHAAADGRAARAAAGNRRPSRSRPRASRAEIGRGACRPRPAS